MEESRYKSTFGTGDLVHEPSPLHLRRLKSQHHEKSSSTSSSKALPHHGLGLGEAPPPASFLPSDVLALSKRVTRGRLGAFALFYESSPRCCFASLSFITRSATLLSTFMVGVTVFGLPYEVLLGSEGLYPAGESFG